MSRDRTVIQNRLAVLLTLATGGCITFQPLEPKLSPPPQYQMDVTARVEFVAPLQIGFRCAERGAKFLGLPGINSGACANAQLMTVPDPCLTLTAGAYALDLCQELSALSDEARSNEERDEGTAELVAIDERPDTPRTPLVPMGADTRRADGSKALTTAPKAIEVEFVPPSGLASRCAERGAMPGSGEGSAACRVGRLLTVANPCHVAQRGWYAEMLCHEMGHVNGWAADHRGGDLARRAPLPYASESPQALALAAAR